jgi:hypothetical protein
VTTATVSVIRVVPLATLTGSIESLAEYLGAVSSALQRQITDLGAKPDGPMRWTPTGLDGTDITYEFAMAYTQR